MNLERSRCNYIDRIQIIVAFRFPSCTMEYDYDTYDENCYTESLPLQTCQFVNTALVLGTPVPYKSTSGTAILRLKVFFQTKSP